MHLIGFVNKYGQMKGSHQNQLILVTSLIYFISTIAVTLIW